MNPATTPTSLPAFPSPAPFAPVLAVLILAGYHSPAFRKGMAFAPASLLTQLGAVYAARKWGEADLLGWTSRSEETSKQFSGTAKQVQENIRRLVTKWPKKAIRILDCILMPFIEEAVFRGFLQPGFQKMAAQLLPHSGATALAVLAASLLFGLSHLLVSEQVTYGVQFTKITFVTGMVFGILKERHGLPCSIGAHMLQNTLVEIAEYGLEVAKWIFASRRP